MRPSFAVLLPLALAVPALAFAQERDTTTRRVEVPRRIEGVIVRTRQAPTVVGGTGAVDVAPDSLRTAPGVTLDQALRTLPFVGARLNSRGETELSVRASDSRQPAVMLEGAPMSAGWDGRADPSVIPLSGATGLRVTRSAPSLLLGPNVLGGVVEVSVADDVAEPRAVIAGGGDGTGGVTSRVLGATRAALGSGQLSVTAGGGLRQRDYVPSPRGFTDPWSLDASRRVNADFRQRDGFAAVRYATPGGAYLSTTVSATAGERGVLPEAHLAAPRFWRLPALDRTVAVLSTGTGPFATPLGTGSVQLRGSLNRGRTIIESFGDQTYAFRDGIERGDDETSSGRLILEHSLGARGDVGLGLSMVQVDYREGLNADPAAFYRQRLWSAGLETDYEFGRGLQLAGSAALDGFSTPLSGGRPALGDRQTWAVRAGLTQTLVSSGVQLTAAAISRSRFPSLREIYSGALGRFLPNPGLRPERLVGTEAGATLYRGAWKWQALAFHQQLDDVILRVNVPGPGRLQQRVNRDAQRTTGLELAGTFTGDRHTLLADLTVQDVRVLDPTQANGRRQVEYQPKVRGSLTGVAPVVLGWRGTAAVQLVGAQYCLNPDSGNYDRLATTGRGDLMVDRSFAVRAGRGVLRSLRLLFAVDNVFDTLTWDQCGLPQPGRLVRLGFELR